MATPVFETNGFPVNQQLLAKLATYIPPSAHAYYSNDVPIRYLWLHLLFAPEVTCVFLAIAGEYDETALAAVYEYQDRYASLSSRYGTCNGCDRLQDSENWLDSLQRLIFARLKFHTTLREAEQEIFVDFRVLDGIQHRLIDPNHWLPQCTEDNVSAVPHCTKQCVLLRYPTLADFPTYDDTFCLRPVSKE